METAGHFVSALVELATGVQFGQDHLGRRDPLSGMNVDGNTATVVFHRDRSVDVDGDADAVTISAQCLIDRVVDDFENEGMQSPLAGVADVHARTLSDSIQTFQN